MVYDSRSSQDNDILDEKYRGPNFAVTVAGEAYYAHIWMAVAGLIGGGALTLLFPTTARNTINSFRKTAEKWVGHENFVPRWTAKAIRGIFGVGSQADSVAATELSQAREVMETARENSILKDAKSDLLYKERGFGYWLLHHTVGLFPGGKDLIKQHTKGSDKIDLAVTSGGLMGLLGFTVVPWIYSFFEGVGKVDRGKGQFKRAQQEVRELREDLQFVEDKNTELRAELRNAKDSQLVVSKDITPKVAQRPEEPKPNDLDVQLKRKDEPDSPVSITPPKIEPPEPAAPPVDHPKDRAHDRGEKHGHHTHHTDGHAASKSHGDAVRDSQAAAAQHHSVA